MSNINTTAINTNYPVPGTNNNSQGFRDNFGSIKNNLDTAKDEITDLQSKAIVKSALNGTSLNNDMGNTLITNAAVQGFRAKTYNLGSNLPETVLIDVTKADVQYGTITQNTAVTFGGWAPAGTQSNVEIKFTMANNAAFVSFPTTTIDNGGNITVGPLPSARLLENYYSNVSGITVAANTTYTNLISVPYGVIDVSYNVSTTDCGTTIDITPINRPQRATQIQIREPDPAGELGDAPGQICTDGSYVYICVGYYDGSTTIWGKVGPITAVT
jgi:hypothetical protein